MGWFRKKKTSPRAKTPREKPATAANRASTKTSAVKSLLMEACGAKMSCVLMPVDASPEVYYCKFEKVDVDGLELNLMKGDLTRGFLPLSDACVVFRMGRSSASFVSTIQLYTPPTKESPQGRLSVLLPSSISRTTEAERVFQIPILAESEVLMELIVRGKRVDIEPVRLSLTGATLKFAGEHNLELGESVSMRLGYDGMEARVTGTICRNIGSTYDIFFLGVLRGRSVSPPEDLRSLVGKIEHAYIRERRKHEG